MSTQPQQRQSTKAQKRLEARVNAYMAAPKMREGAGYRKPGSLK